MWQIGDSFSHKIFTVGSLDYGRREGLLLSCRGFRLFSDRLIGGGDGGGLSTALSPGLRSRAWSPSLDEDLDPLIGEWCEGFF